MSEQISRCEQCQQQYNLFRRKKQCNLCGQIFCSKCVPKSTQVNSSNHVRTCTICLLIINERATHDQLASIRVKHLRAYLVHSKIVSKNRLERCFEKQDLISLIRSRERQNIDEDFVFVEHSNTASSQRSNNDTTTATIYNQALNDNRGTTSTDDNRHESEQSLVNTDEQSSATSPLNDVSPAPTNEPESKTTTEPLPSKVHFKRLTLDDISSSTSIHDLTIRQLKEILVQNFVSITGCVEKTELINKVELLYRDQKQLKESNKIASENSDGDLCKICMDASIDCVFLDCGHLCTCVRCGKRLSECPICRCYIIRVVRVFKS